MFILISLGRHFLVILTFIIYLAVKLMHIKKNKIKVISITSEMILYQLPVIDISLYFCSVFGLPPTFPFTKCISPQNFKRP